MKKYVVTGSIGNISKDIVQGLVKAGNEVSVITSSADRASSIEKLGAKALVGSLQDVNFLTNAFRGKDVAYIMIPPIWQTTDWRKSQNEIAANYITALKSSGVQHVVSLSSIGAHLSEGVGPVGGVHDLEQALNKLEGIQVKHLRPSYFYFNLLSQIGLIKQAGILGGNFGDQEKVFLVHPRDIAAAALEELLSLNFKGNSARYIIGDERSGSEIAAVLGKAIGRNVPWVTFTDEQQKSGLLQAGLSNTHASAYTEMGVALRTGAMQADARKQLPAFSSIKLEDFAKEFAQAFSAS
ncbi:MAG: NmrA family NAD(P)-binding protein [Bacteroidota bacterium]